MKPLTLFDQPLLAPDGFLYHPGFITPEQEQELIGEILKIDLHQMIFQGYTAKRKVASFGFDFNFTTRKLACGEPIPPAFNWLTDKIASQLGVSSTEIAELLITEYPPGSLINWHRDAPPFHHIAGISLNTDCVFKLRPYQKDLRTRKSTFAIPVAARSLYTMQGLARSDWEHSTVPVHQTRYSITVRTLKEL